MKKMRVQVDGDAIATSSLLQQHPYRINSSEFQRSVIGFLADLHESKAYTDVTLYTQGKVLQAHRIVLAASSGYFKELFSTMDQEQHSSRASLVVALPPNVKYDDLDLVIKFIYHGYVDIFNEQLEAFISLAKELRVVGMESGNDNEQQPEPTCTRSKTSTLASESLVNAVLSAAVKEENEEEDQIEDEDDEDDLLEEETDTIDPSRLLATPLVNMEVLDDSSGNLEEPYDNDPDGLMDEEQSSNVIRILTRAGEEQNNGKSKFICGKCHKTYNSNKSLWRHKKFTCDEKIEFKCVCGKTFSRSDNLRRHVVVAHQNVQ